MQFYELPPRVADAFAQWRSWTGSYNLNLIGQDAFPVGAQWDDLSPAGKVQWQVTPQPYMLALLATPAVPLPPGVQMYALPPLGAIDNFAQWRTGASFNINLTPPPPPPPPTTVVYNTVLLSIPGGMFSIPGDPPS